MSTNISAAAVSTLLLGAAVRDFHVFNTIYRDDPAYRVVAFTAAQIPGIPIEDEASLESPCTAHSVRRVVFAYSDVTHAHVMHLGSRALACGADFVLHGPEATMLGSRLPVVAVSALRTGFCVAALRHPTSYGDLARERVQRFASRADLDAAACTIEEHEKCDP